MADLPALFREDGHRLVQRGAEFACLCPFHEDTRPSLTLFMKNGKWGYHCFACKAGGDAVTYLVEFRKMEKKEALRRAGAGPVSPGTGPARTGEDAQNTATPPKGKPKFIERLPANHVGRYVYRSAKGTVRFVVQRYDVKGERVFVPYTRAKRASDGVRGWIRGQRVHSDRPLYRLPELLASESTRQVMVVEGEKCADAVAKASARTVVVAWAGGAGAWRKTDWTPLHGRKLLLVCDGDTAGYECMEAIAGALKDRCPEIIVVRPPLAPEGAKSRDIADEIRDGTDISKWLSDHADYLKGRRPEPRPPPPPPRETDGDIDERLLAGRVVPLRRDGARMVIEVDGRQARYERAELGSLRGLSNVCADHAFWRAVCKGRVTRARLRRVADVLLGGRPR